MREFFGEVSLRPLPWGEGELVMRLGISPASVALAVIGSLASFSMGNRKTFVERVVRGNRTVKYFFTMALRWIANRLNMGTVGSGSLANLLRDARKKR